MQQKTTATKAHVAAVVTAASTVAVGWLSGKLDPASLEALGAAVALAVASWLGTYLAPSNKPK